MATIDLKNTLDRQTEELFYRDNSMTGKCQGYTLTISCCGMGLCTLLLLIVVRRSCLSSPNSSTPPWARQIPLRVSFSCSVAQGVVFLVWRFPQGMALTVHDKHYHYNALEDVAVLAGCCLRGLADKACPAKWSLLENVRTQTDIYICMVARIFMPLACVLALILVSHSRI